MAPVCPAKGSRRLRRSLRAFLSYPSSPSIPFFHRGGRLACRNHFYRMRLVELVSVPAANPAIRRAGGCCGRCGCIHATGAAVCWIRDLVRRRHSHQNHPRQFETYLRDCHLEPTERDERKRNEGLQAVPYAGRQCNHNQPESQVCDYYESPQRDCQRRLELSRHLCRRFLCRQLGDLQLSGPHPAGGLVQLLRR